MIVMKSLMTGYHCAMNTSGAAWANLGRNCWSGSGATTTRRRSRHSRPFSPVVRKELPSSVALRLARSAHQFTHKTRSQTKCSRTRHPSIQPLENYYLQEYFPAVSRKPRPGPPAVQQGEFDRNFSPGGGRMLGKCRRMRHRCPQSGPVTRILPLHPSTTASFIIKSTASLPDNVIKKAPAPNCLS